MKTLRFPLIAIIVCVIISNTHITSAEKIKNFTIWIGHYEIPFEALFKDKKENLYISVEQFNNVIKADYKYDAKTDVLIVKKNNKILLISPGFKLHTKKQVIFNGDTVDLDLPLRNIGQTILLPVKPVASLFGMKLHFKKKTGEGASSLAPPKEEHREPAPPKARWSTPNEVEKQPLLEKQGEIPKPPLKRFGFYLGLSHLKPEVQGLNLDRIWSLSSSAKVAINERVALELRYDSYESSQRTSFLGEDADVEVKTRGLTGYVLYCFPPLESLPRWHYDIGVGLGRHKFILYHDSDTMFLHRWKYLYTFEIKFDAEYCFTENWRTGIELRTIWGNELIVLDGLDRNLELDFNGVYLSLSQRYCF